MRSKHNNEQFFVIIVGIWLFIGCLSWGAIADVNIAFEQALKHWGLFMLLITVLFIILVKIIVKRRKK